MTEERLPGAVNQLKDAIRPLVFQQPVWDGQPRIADPLYTRVRDALTAATAASGAPMQASKAPARIDVLNWLCDVDDTVAHWLRAGTDTIDKLERIHDFAWTPNHLKAIKHITRACETWTAQAKDLLQDNPPVVPLRKPCPLCSEFWIYSGADKTRTFALRVSEHGAKCHACKAAWVTNQEISVLIKMLG